MFYILQMRPLVSKVRCCGPLSACALGTAAAAAFQQHVCVVGGEEFLQPLRSRRYLPFASACTARSAVHQSAAACAHRPPTRLCCRHRPTPAHSLHLLPARPPACTGAAMLRRWQKTSCGKSSSQSSRKSGKSSRRPRQLGQKCRTLPLIKPRRTLIVRRCRALPGLWLLGPTGLCCYPSASPTLLSAGRLAPHAACPPHCTTHAQMPEVGKEVEGEEPAADGKPVVGFGAM